MQYFEIFYASSKNHTTFENFANLKSALGVIDHFRMFSIIPKNSELYKYGKYLTCKKFLLNKDVLLQIIFYFKWMCSKKSTIKHLLLKLFAGFVPTFFWAQKHINNAFCAIILKALMFYLAVSYWHTDNDYSFGFSVFACNVSLFFVHLFNYFKFIWVAFYGALLESIFILFHHAFLSLSTLLVIVVPCTCIFSKDMCNNLQIKFALTTITSEQPNLLHVYFICLLQSKKNLLMCEIWFTTLED